MQYHISVEQVWRWYNLCREWWDKLSRICISVVIGQFALVCFVRNQARSLVVQDMLEIPELSFVQVIVVELWRWMVVIRNLYYCGGAIYCLDNWHEGYADLNKCFYGIHYTDWQRPNCCGIHICGHSFYHLMNIIIYHILVRVTKEQQRQRFIEWAISKLTPQQSICTGRQISQITRITAINQKTTNLWSNYVNHCWRVLIEWKNINLQT